MPTSLSILVSFLAGIGFFLYGVDAMSKGVQKIAGSRLKYLLHLFTGNRVTGLISGTIATSIVQSSTVITVMTVGFVNAGVMSVAQAISVVLGANIGTTITAQLIAFQLNEIILPFIALGSGMALFGRSEKMREWGKTIFGFGLVFFGLEFMQISLEPLQSNGFFEAAFSRFSAQPLLGLLVGMVVTVIVQSSSVTTGITIALAISQVITFEQALPLILGQNIGTTLTANIAAIGGSRAAKQAARAHFIINVLGSLTALILIQPFTELVHFVSGEADTARRIANAHTLFNVLNALILLPFVPGIARLTHYLTSNQQNGVKELAYLEETALQEPNTALDQVRRALSETHGMTHEYLEEIHSTLKDEKADLPSAEHSNRIVQSISTTTHFLEEIVQLSVDEKQARAVAGYVRVIHEIERIRDYEDKMLSVLSELRRDEKAFRPVQKRELSHFFKRTEELLERTSSMLRGEKKGIRTLDIIEEYDSLSAQKERLRQLSRTRYLQHRTGIGLANDYYDFVNALEEIAKKCRNIALALDEMTQ